MLALLLVLVAAAAAAAAQAGLLISCYVAACLKALLIQFSYAEQAGSGLRNESPLSPSTPPPSYCQSGLLLSPVSHIFYCTHTQAII